MPLRLLRRFLLHVEAAVAIDLMEPSGPLPVGCFSALLAPYVSIEICSSHAP